LLKEERGKREPDLGKGMKESTGLKGEKNEKLVV
jgi:hypothetical protein